MTLHQEVPGKIKFLIGLIFFFGFTAYACIVLDAGWTGILLFHKEITRHTLPPGTTKDQPPPPATTGAAAPGGTPTSSAAQAPAITQPQPVNLLDAVRKSIVRVVTNQCKDNGGGHGTGFVVKAGYVATNAHVVANCRRINLVDFQGNTHSAKIKGLGSPGTSQDLAILTFNDGQEPLPPLPLAKDADAKPGEKIQTLGFPLVAVESGQNAPSPSNEGVIASYDLNAKLYYSQGMNINPGNSGGPVFLLSNRKVVGVAMAKSINMQIAEGVGIIIPGKVLQGFFNKKTGENLQ
jgi:S1-C subfamily serine protease